MVAGPFATADPPHRRDLRLGRHGDLGPGAEEKDERRRDRSLQRLSEPLAGDYGHDATVHGMLAQPAPEALPAIARSLASDRLRAFRRATGGNNREAVEMYVVDARVASALHATFRAAEVLLREALHRALSRAFGPRWFDVLVDDDVLDARTAVKIVEARRKARAGRTPPPARVVAQLMLGAWVDLLDRGATGRHEQVLWPVLASTFTARGDEPTRPAVHDLAKRFGWARNRINHCEPVVFGFPLVGERTADGRQQRRSPQLVLEDVRTLADTVDRDVTGWIRTWTAADDLLREPLARRALDHIARQPGVALQREPDAPAEPVRDRTALLSPS